MSPKVSKYYFFCSDEPLTCKKTVLYGFFNEILLLRLASELQLYKPYFIELCIFLLDEQIERYLVYGIILVDVGRLLLVVVFLLVLLRNLVSFNLYYTLLSLSFFEIPRAL